MISFKFPIFLRFKFCFRHYRLDRGCNVAPMEINVIFLDIDGVLNPDKTNHQHVFAPDCVKQLRRILDDSAQTHVVFSTSWRTGLPFFVLGWLWRQHELPLQRVIGRTPEIHTDKRGMEINQWLQNAPLRSKEHRVRRFAILDDEVEPILEVIPDRCVFACDPWHGLTEEVADGVIRHFAGTAASIKPPKPIKTGLNRTKRIP